MKKYHLQTALLLFFSAFTASLTCQFHDADVFNHFVDKKEIAEHLGCSDLSWNMNFSLDEKQALINYFFDKVNDTSIYFYGNPVYKNYRFNRALKNDEISNFGRLNLVFNELDRLNPAVEFKNNQLHTFANLEKWDEINQEVIYDKFGDPVYDTISITDSLNNGTGIGFQFFETWNIRDNRLYKNSLYSTLYIESRNIEDSSILSVRAFSCKNSKVKKRGSMFKEDVVYDFILPKQNYFDTSKNNLLCELDTDFKQGELSMLLSKVFKLIEGGLVKTFELKKGNEIEPEEFNRIFNSFFIVDNNKKESTEQEINNGGSVLIYTKIPETHEGIRFIEDWCFDENNFNIIKEVKGIQILSFDTNLLDKGIKKIKPIPFYISFDRNPPPEKLLKN